MSLQKTYPDLSPFLIYEKMFLGEVPDKRLVDYHERYVKVTRGFVGKMVINFVSLNHPQAPFIILALTDMVLVAILQEVRRIKNGILICLIISIIIGLYELYSFLSRGSGLVLILALLSFVVSVVYYHLWSKK